MEKKPPFNISEDMLEYVSKIAEAIGGIKSVESLDKLPRLRKVGRIKSIQSSLAIENNSLSLDQVSDIIAGKRVLGPPNEIREVENAYAAYEQLATVDPYNINDLLRLHGILVAGLAEEGGRLRSVNEGVYSSDGRLLHIAPQPHMVPELIKNLFDWLENTKVHALIKSSVFHYEIEFIHPFRDGNGRIGRLWQTAILMDWKPIFAWIPVESVVKEKQAEYYEAIAKATSAGNSDAFIIFMLKAILQAVESIAADTRAHINHIDARVRKLLEVMDVYPMSALEIMERLKMKSRNSFHANYLQPAIEAGLVGATEPDKPRSRNQRYFKK